MHAELVHGQGIIVGRNTVSLLMRRASLAGLPARSRGKRTRKLVTVTDLVRRDFRRSGPNQLWVTDITEHPTRVLLRRAGRLVAACRRLGHRLGSARRPGH